jgi:LPXTG-motif cell wall-anchored protein
MQRFALIVGLIGFIIVSSDGPDSPNWVNWLGAGIILLAIALYHVRKKGY